MLFLFAFRFVRLLLSGHQTIAIENAALRIADSSVSRKTEAPAADHLGSVILGLSPQRVVRLATSFAVCPARHRRSLAARTVPQILGQAL